MFDNSRGLLWPHIYVCREAATSGGCSEHDSSTGGSQVKYLKEDEEDGVVCWVKHDDSDMCFLTSVHPWACSSTQRSSTLSREERKGKRAALDQLESGTDGGWDDGTNGMGTWICQYNIVCRHVYKTSRTPGEASYCHVLLIWLNQRRRM